jgi:Glycosyl transferase family 21
VNAVEFFLEQLVIAGGERIRPSQPQDLRGGRSTHRPRRYRKLRRTVGVPSDRQTVKSPSLAVRRRGILDGTGRDWGTARTADRPIEPRGSGLPDAVFWIAGGVVVGCALGSLGCALLFLARLHVPAGEPAAGIVLILPATGGLENLDNLLVALRGQSLRPGRLIISVESPDDPAYDRATALAVMPGEPAVEVVVAGVSTRRGQKCTNILAALTRLAADDRFVVLLDADICPQPWWLAALIAPLSSGRADLVNGYRWLEPNSPTLWPVLVAHIDRALAVLPRLAAAGMVWGGSLALTRQALAALDLPRTLDREVVEDMPIADRVGQAGLRLLTRRAIRVPTPLSGNGRTLWAFARRQGQFVRLYRPVLWGFASAVATADCLARLGLLGDFLAAGSLPALATVALAAALGSLAAELRLAIGRRIGAADRLSSRILEHLLIWAVLPSVGFYVSVIWGSAFASQVRWAHVRYTLDRSGRVVTARRYPFCVREPER